MMFIIYYYFICVWTHFSTTQGPDDVKSNPNTNPRLSRSLRRRVTRSQPSWWSNASGRRSLLDHR